MYLSIFKYIYINGGLLPLPVTVTTIIYKIRWTLEHLVDMILELLPTNAFWHVAQPYLAWGIFQENQQTNWEEWYVTSWWLNQPIWKIWSSNWIISPRGENKNIWNHHLGKHLPSLKLKIGHSKGKRSYSNHPFSGAFAVSFREGNQKKIRIEINRHKSSNKSKRTARRRKMVIIIRRITKGK